MTLFEELQARGLLAQLTDEEEIKELINNGKATFYIGFDPTAIPSRCLTTPLAVSGDPVLPYCYFGKATPGGISVIFPAASHQPAVLCEKTNYLLIPITVFTGLS